MSFVIALGLVVASPAITHPTCRPDWYEPERVGRAIEVEASTTASTRVAITFVDCSERIEVTIERPAGVTEHRSLSLADVNNDLRARTLALALAEMLRTPLFDPRPEPVPFVVVAAQDGARLAAPRPTSWVPYADASVRLYFAKGDALLGGRAGGAAEFGELPIALRMDVSAEGSRTRTAAGAIALLAIQGSLAAHFLVRAKGMTFGIGPRFCTGAARASGSDPIGPIRGGAGWAFLSTAGLEARLAVLLTTPVSLEIGAEFGTTFQGVEALVDERVAGGMAGPFALIRIGASWVL